MSGAKPQTTDQKVLALINEMRADTERLADDKLKAFEELLGEISTAMADIVGNQERFGEILVKALNNGLSTAMKNVQIRVEPKIEVKAPVVNMSPAVTHVAAPTVNVSAPVVNVKAPNVNVAAPAVTVNPKIEVKPSDVVLVGQQKGATWEAEVTHGSNRSMKITIVRTA